ncbi:MAG: DUF4344 domain-containing metallopeptidase [Xanthobacteraceae bacterium]|nr:DUF4344 domain-containing metallopeptidase [Xanthobacteraceae bacterium]
MNSYRFALQTACLLGALIVAYPAPAQLQSVTGVQIEYKEPANPAYRQIYERLKKRQVLEQYREFMSPLKLTRALNVSLTGCGVVNAFHSPSGITYCYELVDHVQRQVAETNVLPGFRREDAIVGGFVSTLLHETGHALFYLLEIPVFGREEDAADAIAAYVALQFGPRTARRILTGTAFVWRASELANQNRNRSFEFYSDEHGTDAQRFYNTLCIAHGSDIVEKTDTFVDFVPLLPENRRRKCGREYLHIKNSFARFVLPHVDQERMKTVRATEWLRSEDGSEVAPPRPLGPSSAPGPSGPGPNSPGTFSPTGPGLGKPK